MAQKGKAIFNADAYDKYIMRFKSDWEASGYFIRDESLLSEKDESSRLKKRWSNQMALLRRKWSKLNRNKRAEKAKEAFLSYQHDEDTATTQQASTHMASGDSI